MTVDLRALVAEASREELPALVGQLAAAQAEALVRLSTPPPAPAAALDVVPLTAEWATVHGLQFETAQKLARTGRLRGATPAPSRGKGSRRRWLVPATLTAAEAR